MYRKALKSSVGEDGEAGDDAFAGFEAGPSTFEDDMIKRINRGKYLFAVFKRKSEIDVLLCSAQVNLTKSCFN